MNLRPLHWRTNTRWIYSARCVFKSSTTPYCIDEYSIKLSQMSHSCWHEVTIIFCLCPVNIEVGVLSLSLCRQIMQLVNQIIYGNIYSDPAEGNTKACKQPQASQSLREGVLLLHRGGLASFRWVKYVFVIIVAAKQLRNMNSIVIVEHFTVTLICIQRVYIF